MRAQGVLAEWDRRSVALLVLLLAAMAGVTYVALTPEGGTEQFTEFSLLNESGVAGDYATELTVGESGTAQVGIVNREGEPVTYTVVVAMDGDEVARYTVTLAPDERDRRAITYTPERAGSYPLTFALYLGGVDDSPDDTLVLQLRVSEPSES